MSAKFIFLSVVLLVNLYDETSGHGMLMDPVNRASRWRVDKTGYADYNDNQGFCGGFYQQWNVNGGKCGFCGDSYNTAPPRSHELGGYYGQGVIVKAYTQGSTVPLNVKITANHRGYVYFKICNLDIEKESDACFERYPLTSPSGDDRFYLPTTSAGEFIFSVRLPSNLWCNHCVIQWTYVAGNNWGMCSNGTGMLGCGNQEHFRTCSDIRITKK